MPPVSQFLIPSTFSTHHLTRSRPGDPLVLAVINPQSGSGKSTDLFFKFVVPVWDENRVPWHIYLTDRQGDCETKLKMMNLKDYKMIVAVGGDGTLAEIINGLKDNVFSNNCLRDINVGIIPVGSGNGLSKSLHAYAERNYSIHDAAEMTAVPVTCGLDLIETTQQLNHNNQIQTKKRTSFLAVTLGLIADVDINSERWRWMGNFRFNLGAIMSIWHNSAYQTTLSYLPEKYEFQAGSAPNPKLLQKISGQFTLIMAANTSHCSSNAHTAPRAKPNDGFLHVSLVPRISRWELVSLLWNLDSGKWISNSTRTFKTKYLKIEEIQRNALMTVDGELVPSLPIECRISKAVASVSCNGVKD